MDKNESIQRQPEVNADVPRPAPDEAIRAGKPAPDAEAPAVDEVEVPAGQWLARNGPLVLILGVLITFAAWYFQMTTDTWFTIGKVALGLGFVIFIHELGHFLVAKWCDVHVTVFSIGFGPALPGCIFKRGETTYKLALFPLGGYVQMVGQVDGDESGDGSDDDPRSFRNKTVWQRMAIISAGVVMNAILAIICFIVVFQGPGKDRQAAVVHGIEPGAPAFIHGLRWGSEIEQIGEIPHPFFEDLMVRTMSTMKGERLTLIARRAGESAPQVLEMEPRLDRADKRPMLGIQPASRLQLVPRRLMESGAKHPVVMGSAAANANPPFEFGDVIIGITDPDHPHDPAKMTLPPDPHKPEQRDYFEYAKRLRRLAGRPVTIRVLRGDEGEQKQVDIQVPTGYALDFGMRMQMGQLSAIRKTDSPAADAGLVARQLDASGTLRRLGDVIQKVEVPEPTGGVTVFEGKTLDPARLPFDLRQWADRYHASKGFRKGEKLVKLQLRRHRDVPGQQFETADATLEWNYEWRFDRMKPFSEYSPLAIPELGLAYQVNNAVAHVPDNHSLQKNEVIKKVKIFYLNADGSKERSDSLTFKAEDQWALVAWMLQSPGILPKMIVSVERNGKLEEIQLSGNEDRTWPIVDRGLVLDRDVRKQRADNTLDAIAMGFTDTWNNMSQIFSNLRGMILGRISTENLGGPVTIARVAYKIAGYDFWEFVFFIGLISVNLAVINFLPIPVLDGGHMVFLIYEKIRGKPASEGVRIGATYAGLALILSLMVYVLYLDFFVH